MEHDEGQYTRGCGGACYCAAQRTERGNILLSYYTLADAAHRLAVGARPLGGEPIIEIDPGAYPEELALKEALLAEQPGYCFQAQAGTEAAQWEALALILEDMQRSRPDVFALARQGSRWSWRNSLKRQETSFCYGDSATLPSAPLDWAGREVQEDLLLLDGADPFPLTAGQLCFPNRWCLDEKMGQAFAAIHAPVPGFAAEIGRSSGLLLARLKPGRPVWRANWALVVGGELDLSPRMYGAVKRRMAQVTPANCGELCFVRVERQTLTRLPQTGAVLFTVHTYRSPLGQLAADPHWARRFADVLAQAEPQLLAYKGVTPLLGALQHYLHDSQRRWTDQ